MSGFLSWVDFSPSERDRMRRAIALGEQQLVPEAGRRASRRRSAGPKPCTRADRDERIARYRSRLDAWAASEEAAEHPRLDTRALWELMERCKATVPSRTQHFVNEWARLCEAADLRQVIDDDAARHLVRHREQRIKTARSRFTNRRALDQWSDASATGRLEFRWSEVQGLLPYSRDQERLTRLKKNLVAYRLVFGAPRQQEFLSLVRPSGTDTGELQRWVLDLRPPDPETEAPSLDPPDPNEELRERQAAE